MSPTDSIALAESNDTVVVLVDTFPEETDEVDPTLGIGGHFTLYQKPSTLLASLLGAGRFEKLTLLPS
eukprot:scaffold16307_cov98-Skeletonema_marinoi.AAC.1